MLAGSEMVGELAWVVGGAVLTLALAYALVGWTIREGRTLSPRPPRGDSSAQSLGELKPPEDPRCSE
jgi:hypothetical protein